LATLLAAEVHISDVERALQRDAVAKGMTILTSQRPAMQRQWHFGRLYFATPEKLDAQVPLVKKEVRQAMNMAINRQAIADTILGGRVEPHRSMGYHRELDGAIWPGSWNPAWDARFDMLYGYNPAKARELLARAGYPQGFEFTVYLYHLPDIMPPKVEAFIQGTVRSSNGHATCALWRSPSCLPGSAPFPAARAGARSSL
jgi:ABC-type transport system substrate-binding protein